MTISKSSVMTQVFDTILAIAAKYPGIGVPVTFYARTSGIATLTTQNPHGFVVGDALVVRGTGDSTFDGEPIVLTIPTLTTFTYAAPGANVSTPIACTAGASNRIGAGYRRFGDTENWEDTVAGLSPETQAWFDLEIDTVTLAENEVFPAKLIGALFVHTPKDVSTNLSVAWDFVTAFLGEVVKSANYTSLYGIWPSKVTVRHKKTEDVDDAGITTFDLGNYGSGGIEVPDP